TLGRLGAIIGWGAPWNDVVPGFLAEAGVAAGELRGTGQDGMPCTAGAPMTVISASGEGRCYGAKNDATTRDMSPCLGWWLLLQVPWKFPVRPVAGFGTLWTMGSPVGTLDLVFDGGVVWQAW